MDPLTACLLSGLVVGVVKKANDSALDVGADWRALRNGEELPSHKRREALLQAQKEAIAKGVADPTRMTATQYSRMLNSIGRQPGILMLARNQYRNMVAAADRRLSSYWDEMERRAEDDEYRAKRERDRERAQQEAQDRREERKRRFREGYDWVKTGTANRTKNGREKLRDWLGDNVPRNKKAPPPDDPPEGSGDNRRWWERWGRPTTDNGDPGTDGGGPGRPNGYWSDWFSDWSEEPDGHGPYGPEDHHDRSHQGDDPADRERYRRANEWADWIENNQRYGNTTVTEEPTPGGGQGHAPQPSITRGPGALGPAPDTSTDPTAGGKPMADQNNTPTPPARSGGGGIAKSSVAEFNRKAEQQITKPIENPPGSRKPAGGAPAPAAPARYRKGTAQKTARTRGRAAALKDLVLRLDHLIQVFDAGAVEIRDIVEDLSAIRAGAGLQEALAQWSANISRDTAHGRQVTQYLAMADAQIGAVASQFQEAPKDLDAYSGVNG